MRLSGIVLGKFFAALVVFLLGVCVTLVYVLIVATWGTLEFATVLGNYVAICATAMAFISIGVFISSLTQNQLVACIATVAVFLGLYLLDGVIMISLRESFPLPISFSISALRLPSFF